MIVIVFKLLGLDGNFLTVKSLQSTREGLI